MNTFMRLMIRLCQTPRAPLVLRWFAVIVALLVLLRAVPLISVLLTIR